MSHYQPYPAYKDSEVEWLGRVPEHWDVKAIRWLSPIQRGASPRPIDDPKYFDDEGEYGWVRIEDVTAADGVLKNTKQRLSALGANLSVKLQPGALFLSIAGTVGKPCVAGAKVCIHDGFVYFPMLKSHADWLFKIFESRTPFIGLGKMGTQLNLNTETVGSIKVGLPPISEALQILSSLDRETARIDALIEKKTRFIELLREKRQALITHAVTKGLDPSVKMKNSGVEWLGEVPEHWAVCKLSFRYSVELGKMLDEKRITSTSLMPYLRNQDVQWDAVNAEDLPEMDIHPEELSRYTVRAGDLLVCEGGDVGRAAIWRGENNVIGYQKALHRLRPRDDATDTAEFFFFALMAAKMRGVFEESDSKATIAHLPAEKFRQYRFAFPSAHEQRDIASHIRTHAQRLDKVQLKTEHSITLLKERRSALITAAVTGQIDLREAV
ncbi:restriction endonuclease subunit S [Aquipseudomonas alcaligenes]|uniref:Restriction modification system DNA specificity domain-containing protein n=1 Tax=Aquipseudomonas alcaligenes TaxID=43263 RepID=A0AA37CIB0_AQUAC|nr:restriction endonuclease subunit S [Pseudomonas alcaligenes]BCR22563.1 restriction modification system DNA specificity domain-containing protein [Pseudomonas alcaligenes]GIZ68073.1 restriction modification system DNA specificity domain-containing protein [Pseudomonas alcaligenes]GIZ72588.1 restriction modification system DNA specificity domain-containing protein [Pseudomonas alcaligenes]GIZ76939.1 restriction modification system DNA specificity domain-containing protein [Pseudomonas alcalige